MVVVAGFATSGVILRRAIVTNGSIAPSARPDAEQLAEYDADWRHRDATAVDTRSVRRGPDAPAREMPHIT